MVAVMVSNVIRAQTALILAVSIRNAHTLNVKNLNHLWIIDVTVYLAVSTRNARVDSALKAFAQVNRIVTQMFKVIKIDVKVLFVH
jgi:hypothetical protein